MITTTMEVIVRPFAPVIITPPARAPRATGVAADPIAFSLGGKGGRTLSITLDKNKVVVEPDKNKDLKESGRESTKVRVENEDDPDQFVEFCRANKIKMSPKKLGSPESSASHASSEEQSTQQQGQQKDTPQEFTYKYPSDKTCKSPSEPPKGCQ